jgi:hypothetical protein
LPLLGEWTILPLPTYMPTWPLPLKNIRSPGCNLLHETFFLIDLYWLCVILGRDTPAFRQAYRTSPEQSNAPGPEAPHRYGSPICFLAAETALPARVLCSAALLFLVLPLPLALDAAVVSGWKAVFVVLSAFSEPPAALLTSISEGPSAAACAAVGPRVTAPAEAVRVRAIPPSERRKRRDRRGLYGVVDRISPWDFH